MIKQLFFYKCCRNNSFDMNKTVVNYVIRLLVPPYRLAGCDNLQNLCKINKVHD